MRKEGVYFTVCNDGNPLRRARLVERNHWVRVRVRVTGRARVGLGFRLN
jgi:hypothetical protein